MAPSGDAVGPSQTAAMEAAATAAVQQLQYGGGGPPGARPTCRRQRRRRAHAGGGTTINSRNALDTLYGHFPGETNTIVWQAQPPSSDGCAARARRAGRLC